MSMLAEHRRKTKWVINPTKKPIWSTDSSGIKFGKQLMEKMGWSAGKGLGLNEQGIQEPLKVSFKNDTKGMGFKGNDDNWIEQQDEFNILLSQLNQDDTSVVRGSDAEKNEVKSLEEKSKQSKARVHYQKFTRGKDLSRYSENDLACILGTNKAKKKENTKTEETIETETNLNGNCETSFGVTTINSGSINDYFKKKWTADKIKINDLTAVDDGAEENFRPNYSIENPCFSVNEGDQSKKVDKLKYQKEQLPLEENETPESGYIDGTDKVQKKKRKGKVEIISKEEPKNKKRRKNIDDNTTNENSSEEPETLLIETESIDVYGEKKKGIKDLTRAEMPGDEVKLRKEQKERKGTKRDSKQFTTVTEELQETEFQKKKEINSTNDGDASLEVELITRKKKKKNKKEKSGENEVCQIVYDYDNQGVINGSCLEIEPINNKKEKKYKKLKLEKSYGNNDSSDMQDVSHNDLEKTVGQNIEDIFEMQSGKTKKKKKIEEFDETNQVLASGETAVEMNDKNEFVELESDRKKKKKRKKDHQKIENERCGNETEKPCLGGTITPKTGVQCEGEESVKKKKKKKDKKEKLTETESKGEESCLEKSKNYEENDMDAEFSRKKKKKKDKVEDTEATETKGEQSCQFNTEECKEAGGEVNNKGTDLIKSNGVLNTNSEERMQKLRANLFPDTAAEKYFPQQSQNERVLKLIRWANIAEFKGSNLRDVEGYGRRKAYEKQSR